jgi:two-component system sensor histidine kinase KdpD
MARFRFGAWFYWITVLVVATAVLRSRRDTLDTVHVVLTYLLVVLGGSVGGGRPLGVALTVAGVVSIDYFFQLPYDTLSVAKPLDWVVLLAFLTTAAVATQLLAQERARAAVAERRASEVASLGRFGAEILSADRAEDTLVGIAELIRTSLDVARCQIYGWDESTMQMIVASPPFAPGAAPVAPDMATLRRLAEARVDADGPAEAGVSADGCSVLAALRARGRTVGVLHLTDGRRIALDPARQRFLGALAYYAALAVERARLVAKVEHAEALKEADRLKDIVLASVSHDLRTPLTTIKALAQSAALRGDQNAVAIEEQADRLGHLVADLLDLSRLKSGALPIHPELNTAEDLVGAALRQIGGLLQERTVQTAVDLSQPALVGRFDFVQSLRILNNLLENAVRYSPHSSSVELAVRREGPALVFAVSDGGAGVPPSERERIFEPFYRALGTPGDVGGSGLGLAIARRLAELQGGSLEYVPRTEGGSIFVLRLPAGDVGAVRDAASAAVV